MPKYMKGNIFEEELRNWGGSIVLVLDPDLCEYLQVKGGDIVVLKCEDGKYGAFLGVGKKGKH